MNNLTEGPSGAFDIQMYKSFSFLTSKNITLVHPLSIIKENYFYNIIVKDRKIKDTTLNNKKQFLRPNRLLVSYLFSEI